MTQVAVKPELLRWAIERSGLPQEKIAQTQSLKKIDEWVQGTNQPTLKQLEKFAKKTRTPFGYLFLSKPPEEKIPVPDFRTMKDRQVKRPSPDLIDTIHLMQQRQAWMRDFVIDHGQERLAFVGEGQKTRSVPKLAQSIREKLKLQSNWAQSFPTRREALSHFRDQIEKIGVMVSMSGVVGGNTSRALDPEEFRGFVLCDQYAPLIFVNSNDSKSAQMFTLAHELVHIWIGKDGLFNLLNGMPDDNKTEVFCNKVAAELLIPAELVKQEWDYGIPPEKCLENLLQLFKVSPVAVARKALDLDLISRKVFFDFYAEVQDKWKESQKQKKSGGDFYRTSSFRLGTRFSTAIAIAAREGDVLLRDAYKLTGMKSDSFEKYTSRLMQEN